MIQNKYQEANIRSGPGTNYDLIAKLPQGSTMEYLGSSGEWLKGRLPDGKIGWVANWLAVVKEGNSNDQQPSGRSELRTGGKPISLAELEQIAGAWIAKFSVITPDWSKLSGGTYSAVQGALLKVTKKLPDFNQSSNYLEVKVNRSGKAIEVVLKASNKITYSTSRRLLSGEFTLSIKGAEINPRQFPVQIDDDNLQSITYDGRDSWGNDKLVFDLDKKVNPTIRQIDSKTISITVPSGKRSTLPYIKSVKVENRGQDTTVLIEADRDISEWTTLSLDEPDRLVIDIPDALLSSADSLDNQRVSRGDLTAVRVSQYRPEVVRVVLDLTKPLAYQVASRQDAPGLQITLSPSFLTGKVIVVDPGHGTNHTGWLDSGAIGVNKVAEHEIVLDIAKKLADELKSQGAKVVLTREGIANLPLDARANLANELKADVFVSIHGNSTPSSKTNGTTTYFYAPDELSDAAKTYRKLLATKVQESLVEALGREDRGIKQERFVVLRLTEMPSILVETAFLSNPEEAELLAREDFRAKAAQGIARGLANYFQELFKKEQTPVN